MILGKKYFPMLNKIAHYIRRFYYNRTRKLLPSYSGGHAACGQDIFVASLLNNKRNGTFVDIGANDGVTISNTLYFEKELGWNGLAVEPLPSIYAKLQQARSCKTLNACISKERGKASFIELEGAPNMLSTLESNFSGLTKRRINNNAKRHNAKLTKIDVECLPFSEAMEMFSIKNIDFLSIDTEGGELEILKSIDFSKHPTKVISVENNYFKNDIYKYLESKGFSYVGTFKIDEIYIHKTFTQNGGRGV